VIEGPGDGGDCPPGNYLADENHSTLKHEFVPALHVQTKVHFLEVAMKRERNPQNFRIEEAKPDQAYECLAFHKSNSVPAGQIAEAKAGSTS